MVSYLFIKLDRIYENEGWKERAVSELSRKPKRQQNCTFEDACNILFSARP